MYAVSILVNMIYGIVLEILYTAVIFLDSNDRIVTVRA